MPHLFDPTVAAELKARIRRLEPASPRQWGKMDAAQALAHCAIALEAALGDLHPKRAFIGRLLGRVVKRLALGNEQPFRRNSPTAPEYVVADAHDLAREQERLCGLVDRFAAGGPSACTRHPHTFFGPLSPQEWAVLMHKHLDHHLRQFGV